MNQQVKAALKFANLLMDKTLYTTYKINIDGNDKTFIQYS